MRTNSTSDREESVPKRVALLWDESFLWGVMAHKALDSCGLPYELVCADDIRRGRLQEYAMLFVPGGWASNKQKALGDEGVAAIRKFVHEGGSYVGFCGGAGLATEDGIGLLPVKRRPTKERVPSFSGPIRLNISNHPLWRGIAEAVFHAWWPSQFMASPGVNVLATYGEALPGSFSSDLNVVDAERGGGGWKELERVYQINLDPRRLLREPAVIEGTYGKGKVLASLIHFDTPDDRNGEAVLKNLWQYLIPNSGFGMPNGTSGGISECALRIADCETAHAGTPNSERVRELEAVAGELIDLGQRNFLWFWRNPLLLQWRRGVRGLEYCSLFIITAELAARLHGQATAPPDLEVRLERIRSLFLPFAEKAQLLLVRERHAMQNSRLTYEHCDDPEIRSLREELFSRSKSHGGLFKDLLDQMDGLLYQVMSATSRR